MSFRIVLPAKKKKKKRKETNRRDVFYHMSRPFPFWVEKRHKTPQKKIELKHILIKDNRLEVEVVWLLFG